MSVHTICKSYHQKILGDKREVFMCVFFLSTKSTLGLLGFFLLSAVFFSKSTLFQKIFQEYHLSVIQIGSRSGPTFCRA